MKSLYLSFCLLLFTSCASYQPGKSASFKTGEKVNGLTITSHVSKDLSNDYFKYINFTFGNEGPDWIRVKQMKLLEPTEKNVGPLNIVIGQDLATWSESLLYMRSIDRWNRQVLLGSIAAIGTTTAVVGMTERNYKITIAGADLAYGTYGIALINNAIDTKKLKEKTKMLPANHIYRPFSVPSEMYSKKWILIKSDSKVFPKVLNFEIEFMDGKKSIYSFNVETTTDNRSYHKVKKS